MHARVPTRVSRAAALTTAGALLAAGCTGTFGERGATTLPDGPGDPYYPELGNGGYQVDHYDLAVQYDPADARLDGEITVHATARAQASLSVLEFDLVGLDVETVTVDGTPAETQRPEEKLQITPEEAVPAGEDFTVSVDYEGAPDTVHNPRLGSNGFHPTDDGGFAIGEPVSASTWFPVNGHPQDKATYDLALTVPEDTAAVSNGVPQGQETTDGWTTWRWHVPTPTASYLITAAIGDYRVHEDTHDGRPVVTAVHEDLPAGADAQLRRTPDVADQLAEWFGPYPASAYGGIALADERVGFALETQSRPVYGPPFFAGGVDATGVIVHELAHQWFGNSVSVHTWDEIWLNEGFATYAEWLWTEHQGGDTAQEIFDATWDGLGADDSFWSPPPGDPGAGQLFSTPVYQRGAMALHVLRRTVGDDAFFEILRTWAEEHAGGNATTDDLITLSERVADRELDDLFDTWVYATERPAYPGD